MGCDIHGCAEVWREGRWVKVGDVFPLHEHDDRRARGQTHGDQPFDWRSYAMFGLLANVRNSAHVPTIAAPRGCPDGASPEVLAAWQQEFDWGGHTPSWLTVAELQAFDYDQTYWDEHAEAPRTVREVLPAIYFHDLAILSEVGKPEEVRVVFWFDS